jgi:hypothetical protein
MAITLKKLQDRFSQMAANDLNPDHLFIPFMGAQGVAASILAWFGPRSNLSRSLDSYTPTQISTAMTALYASLTPADQATASLIVAGKPYTPLFTSAWGYEKVIIYVLLNAATA